MRAIIRIGFAEAEQATAVLTPQRREQIIEPDADEAGSLDQINDRAQTLANSHVGDTEGLMNSGFGRDHVAHSIVLETDHRVGNLV